MRCSSGGLGLLEQHGSQIRLRRSQVETWSCFGGPAWARFGELGLGPLRRAGYSVAWREWDRLAELRVGFIPRAMTLSMAEGERELQWIGERLHGLIGVAPPIDPGRSTRIILGSVLR